MPVLALCIFGLGSILAGYNRLFDSSSKNDVAILAMASEALIGWALSHPDTPAGTQGTPPGMLPWPDRNNDKPNYYDGLSDCPNFGNKLTNVSLRFGRIPYRGTRQTGTPDTCWSPSNNSLPGIIQLDPSRQILNPIWYGVSLNLLDDSNINTYPTNINPADLLELDQNWITICDINGQLLTHTAALVLISSGSALAAQDRSGPGPDAREFLEKVNFPAGVKECGASADNGAAGTKFIHGPSSSNFNDSLTWVDRDEYVRRLAIRGAGTLFGALNRFWMTKRQLPASISDFPDFPNWFGPGWVRSVEYRRMSESAAIVQIKGEKRPRCYIGGRPGWLFDLANCK